MKTLALIPARGGSKGVPKKNIRNLDGKPLIYHTIDSIININSIDSIVVSTDSVEIAEIASNKHVSISYRPSELAKDNSLVYDTIVYTIRELEAEGKTFDNLLLLEPTSPIRRESDILKCIEVLNSGMYDSVASFSENHVPPHRLWRVSEDCVEPFFKESNPFMPRQSMEKGYFLNGVLYGAKIESMMISNAKSILFGKVYPLVIPIDLVVDIDNEFDFSYAEFVIKKYK
jgi:CMP-N,N'-diacetyllegionaminic acid synthase